MSTNASALIAGARGTAYGSAASRKMATLAADWLYLAAAPTFALMALLTAVFDGGPLQMLCSAAQGASSLNGMVPMYLLMSAFHSSPWLRMISSRRKGRSPAGEAAGDHDPALIEQ